MEHPKQAPFTVIIDGIKNPAYKSATEIYVCKWAFRAYKPDGNDKLMINELIVEFDGVTPSTEIWEDKGTIVKTKIISGQDTGNCIGFYKEIKFNTKFTPVNAPATTFLPYILNEQNVYLHTDEDKFMAYCRDIK